MLVLKAVSTNSSNTPISIAELGPWMEFAAKLNPGSNTRFHGVERKCGLGTILTEVVNPGSVYMTGAPVTFLFSVKALGMHKITSAALLAINRNHDSDSTMLLILSRPA